MSARHWLAALVVMCWASVAPAEEFSGKVVGVSDGDTITVLRDRTPVKVRLNGIDCPETGQDFGSRAKAVTSELVFDQVVRVVPRDTDNYGRTVADVFLADGRSLNHELVRSGFAWWYRKYAPNDGTLARLETEARAATRGLWAQRGAVAPWDWRHTGPELPATLAGKFLGNQRSLIYHQPGCPNGAKMSETNRVPFGSAAEAERAGYRAGKDCSPR